MTEVALTFDVGYPDQPGADPNGVAAIVRTLSECGVRATFFVQGAWCGAHPALARLITDGGHLLGAHSHWHAPYPVLTREGVLLDLYRCRKALVDATGVDPAPWFRLPFGRGVRNEKLIATLLEVGFESVFWNVDARDWQPDSTGAEVVDRVSDGIDSLPGAAVVLMHGWTRSAVAALPDVIANAAPRRFVTVDELDLGFVRALPDVAVSAPVS